jgi:hypothetical protein
MLASQSSSRLDQQHLRKFTWKMAKTVFGVEGMVYNGAKMTLA